jgi:antitoxin ParD1/3/4
MYMNKANTTTTMNVSLSETLRDYVNERVGEGIYSNTSDYIRTLIRADMKRRADQQLEAALLEGIASGPAAPMTQEDWQYIREEGARRAAMTPQTNL